MSLEGGAMTPALAMEPASARATPRKPVLRYSARARSVHALESELARIWSSISLTTPGPDGTPERRVAPRTSVMNLVVVPGRGEVGERAAAIVEGLTGRHPSRTLIVSPADPDGPSWLDAQVQAHCILPSDNAPETCSEMVYMTCGGEAGQHLSAIVAPLLIHDLPVTVWWPGEPHFESRRASDMLPMADRVLVDGSAWGGDGLAGLAAMVALPGRFDVEICDFALLRQARWREAIASTFDRPHLQPFLWAIDRIDVRYASADGLPGTANVVRPVYHVAWLASRLKMRVRRGLQASAEPWGGYAAVLRQGHREVQVSLQPVASDAPRGTTLSVTIHASRRGSELAVQVTAYAEGVVVQASLDGAVMPERRFHAPRKREADLLAQAIDAAGRDPISIEVREMTAQLLAK